MATIVPSKIPVSATAGEKRLHRILQRLPDDCVVYYEPVVRGRHPDFVILCPRLGILVIEDKNWKLSTIVGGDRKHLMIRKRDGSTKSVPHPEQQARNYNNLLRDVAEQVRYGKVFLHAHGTFQGRLTFPVGHLVTLSNINANELDGSDLPYRAVFPGEKTVTRDEMLLWEDLPSDQLLSRLKEFFDPWWAIAPMSENQVNALRALIHPEICLENQFSAQKLLEEPGAIHDQQDVIKTLDLRQEEAAISIGEGHRILFGVAGSGKTIILLMRARLLAQRDPEAEILVVCYNRELARWMEGQMADHPRIQVSTFHSWGSHNEVPFIPNQSEESYGEAFLSILENGSGDAGKFDAILVDEAQDFEPNWFRCLLMAMKDPEDGDLFIVADGAQSLYRRNPISWKSLGIKAQGRTSSKRFDLDRNYRNSTEILCLAETFAMQASDDQDDEDHILSLRVNPQLCERSTGASPWLLLSEDPAAECDHAIELVTRLLAGRWQGRDIAPLAAEEIAILYPRVCWEDKALLSDLPKRIREKTGVDAEWFHRKKRSGKKQKPALRIQTIHSAKGLQFRAVIILWAGAPLHKVAPEDLSSAEAENRRLLYVAMTRAESFLGITGSGDSQVLRDIENSPACSVYRSGNVRESVLAG